MLVSITCHQVEGLKTIYISATGDVRFAFENENKKNSACEKVSRTFLSRLGLVQLEEDQKQSSGVSHNHNKTSLHEEFVISYQPKLDTPIVSNKELIQYIVNLMATKTSLRRIPIVELHEPV
jgi:hypothetical protein